MGNIIKYLIFSLIAIPFIVMAFIYTLLEIIIDNYKIKTK